MYLLSRDYRVALVGVIAPLLFVPTQLAAQPSDSEAKALQQSLQQDALTAPIAPTPTDAPATALADSNPNLSLILDTAAAFWSTKENSSLETGGHDPSRLGFNLQQLELHFDSNVDPYLRLDANLVFGRDGFELEEAYASTLALPGRLKVRAGQFLTPFGRLNMTHPHAWSFVDQPLAIGEMLGPDGSRGLGAEVSWLAPLPWYCESFLAVNQPGPPIPAGNSDLRDLFATAAIKQFWPLGDDWGLLFGLSTQQRPERPELYGVDLNLRWRPVDDPSRKSLTLQAEWIVRMRSWNDSGFHDSGGYVQLVAALDPRWEMGLREESLLEQRGTVSDLRRRRHAAQVTFYPSHFSRLRLQGQLDDAAWLPQRIWGVLLALEIVAGAHGAHTY